MNLVVIRGLRSSLGYFKGKQFLSINEIYQVLQNRDLNESGTKMKWVIEQTRTDLFLRLPVEFPITGLQHVTTRDCMEKILRSQSFIGRSYSPRRADFKDLSFWAADIPSNDIERTREEVYAYVQERIVPYEAGDYREEIRRQFANSPAFNNSASRFGNFRFSFPFSYLLSRYGAQFCDGGKPQLRILGTDIYKQEIVHYIVVHRPDATRFMDLPRVPTIHTRSGPLPFVYQLDDTLYWRPESTTNELSVLTGEGYIRRCEVREVRGQRYDKDLCVWNLLTFAFHISGGQSLHIPGEMLRNNLSACEALHPFMKDSKMEKAEAEENIERVMQQYQKEK